MAKYRIISPTTAGLPGDVIDLPEDEGRRWHESGIAVPVEAKERAVVEPKVERAVEERPKPAKRKAKKRAAKK